MKWHIGCSGFHYKDWKGRFYPEDLAQKKWFDYYCEHFRYGGAECYLLPFSAIDLSCKTGIRKALSIFAFR